MRFSLASENTNKKWSFDIDTTEHLFLEWANAQDHQIPRSGGKRGQTMTANYYHDFVSEMEDHGVLDFGGRVEEELFHSYEIEEDMFPVIIVEFQEFFKANGFTVGEVEIGQWN